MEESCLYICVCMCMCVCVCACTTVGDCASDGVCVCTDSESQCNLKSFLYYDNVISLEHNWTLQFGGYIVEWGVVLCVRED